MKLKKILFSPAATIIAFVLAAALLLFSTIGGARAALTYVSGTYQAQMALKHIGVTLFENEKPVAWQNFSEDDNESLPVNGKLLTDPKPVEPDPADPESEEPVPSFELGKSYFERLKVQNSGDIGQYVRVTIYRYWVDGSAGAEDRSPTELPKLRELKPSFIQLNMLTGEGSNWVEDEDAQTKERSVYYYTKPLDPGQETDLLSDTLTVNGDLKATITESQDEDGNYKIKYDYNGIKFVLEASVDAVQVNNAQAAALSAWGRNVTIAEDGTLALGPIQTPKPATGETAGSTPETAGGDTGETETDPTPTPTERPVG